MSLNGMYLARQLLHYVEADLEDQPQELLEAASNLIKKVAQKPTFSSVLLAWIYDRRGDSYYNLKEDQRAIQDYDRAIELDPNYARAYNNRGWAYDDLQDYQRAIQDYDRAIELDPNDAVYYNNRGFTYDNLKEYQRAIQDYDRAIELNPNDAQTYSNRGFAYLWLKDVKQARADYTRSRELDPTSAINAWMAEWVKMCQDRVDADMRDKLEMIAKLKPEHYEAFVCQGTASWLDRRFEEALRAITQAISLEPENSDAYFWEGMIYASLEKDAEALISFEKAIAVGLPPVLLTTLGWLKQEKPDFYQKYALPLLTQYGL